MADIKQIKVGSTNYTINADKLDGYHSSSFSLTSHTHDFSDINSRGEAFLSWGGQSLSGSYAPVDAAMVSCLGAIRSAFLKAAGVVVEYSRDGGSTWTDYGATDSQKVSLFSGISSSFSIGKATSAGSTTANYKLRITINTGAAQIYTTLNKFVVYVSTNGSSGTTCTIQGRLQSNYESGTETWVTFANKAPISGWSGYNVINTSGITTYGNTKASQYGQVRFIFENTSCSTSYSGLIVSKIMCFGGVGWTAPSTMASTGLIYSYDSGQNVSFPAEVSATSFTGNLTGNVTGNVSGSSGSCTGNAATATTASKLGTNAGSATQPVYFSNGVPVATTYSLAKSVPSNAVFTDTHYTNSLTIKGAGTAVTTFAQSADKALDIVAGSNITVTPDATNGKITIASTNTDTHYTHALTIQGNGTTATTFSQSAAKTLNIKPGSNVTVSAGTDTITIASSYTDTKNTAGSTDTSSKIFLVGATSQAANPQTYSHDTAYVGTDGCLYSGGTKVLTSHQDISGKANVSEAGYSLSVSGTSVSLKNKSGTVLSTITTQDTNTTYSAGTGLSLSGTTFNHSNSVTAITTAGFYKVKHDAQGHITGTTAVAKSDITGLGLTYSDVGASASSHTHSYAGSSSAGGAATSANKVNASVTFNNGGSGAASGTTFDGSTARTISYNTIGAASASHTHNYAGSSSAGGAANSVKAALTFNNGGSGVATGTTFDGSTARTVSYNSIGAASATALTNLSEKLKGNVYREEQGTSPAYTQNVPQYAKSKALLSSIGGKSVNSVAQKCDKVVSYGKNLFNPVRTTNVGDTGVATTSPNWPLSRLTTPGAYSISNNYDTGSVTFYEDGFVFTSGGNGNSLEIPFAVEPNTTYMLSFTPVSTYWEGMYTFDASGTFLGYAYYKCNTPFTTGASVAYIALRLGGGTRHDVQLEKGSVVTDFEYYRDPVELTIPTAVQNLDGYGTGNDTIYSELLLEPILYPNMKSVDLGTLDYTYDNSGSKPRFYTTSLASTIELSAGNLNLLSRKYAAASSLDKITGSSGTNDYMYEDASGYISFPSGGATTAPVFKASVSGIILHYKAREGAGVDYNAKIFRKKETDSVGRLIMKDFDVTSYFPEGDIFLDVSGGSTLTFHQTNGTTTELPNKITYMVDVFGGE